MRIWPWAKEILRNLYGYEAKKIGKELKEGFKVVDPDFKEKIMEAIRLKIVNNDEFYYLFVNSELPFLHYYNFNGKFNFCNIS